MLNDDPRYAYQGRTVSLADVTAETAQRVIALVRLQGYASCHFTPRNRAAGLLAQFEAAGLHQTQWDQYWGRDSALAMSRAFLDDYRPEQGLSLQTVRPDTPDAVLRDISEMSIRSGVFPPPGSSMRGDGIDGAYLYVRASDGKIVACGGAFMAYHRDGPRADEAFWGMLATDADWRGHRLACWVGAQVILDMSERFGARGFSSGVKADNPSSQAMCTRLGVCASDFVYAGASDPRLVGNAPVTR